MGAPREITMRISLQVRHDSPDASSQESTANDRHGAPAWELRSLAVQFQPARCFRKFSATATRAALVLTVLGISVTPALAQSITVRGSVRDDTGGLLPGVSVQLRHTVSRSTVDAVSDGAGRYTLAANEPGRYEIRFSLINFSHLTRSVTVAAGQSIVVDIVLPLALTAEVAVTGMRTFRNVADAENPDETLIGLADAASEGAVTARQLENRPLLRPGEVLESIPGLVISQHSGEGKANQYYLRGFNLDHGTDFAVSVAGTPSICRRTGMARGGPMSIF